MIITKETLIAKGACQGGIDAFVTLFQNGLDLSTWTREKEIEILLSPLGCFVGWGIKVGIIPCWSLSGSDLSRSDLSGSDLSGSDLSRSDLSRSDLSGSDLSGSDLSGSDLSGSDLSGSDLSRSNLIRAKVTFEQLALCASLRDAMGV